MARTAPADPTPATDFTPRRRPGVGLTFVAVVPFLAVLVLAIDDTTRVTVELLPFLANLAVFVTALIVVWLAHAAARSRWSRRVD